MYSSFQLARNYLRYYLTASNGRGHGMHSPFVFDFILNVLHNGKGYALPDAIETHRRQLLRDRRVLTVEDLGAGSRTGGTKQREVRAIARTALKGPKLARVLYRLAKHYHMQHVLELGTSLGITTACLASGAGRVDTIEGSAAIAAVAREGFDGLGLKNIISHTGNFDDVLGPVLRTLPALDLAYVDGNHRYEPTMRYFRQLLDRKHEGTILVFDDIHWSEGMERAWGEIKAHPTVAYTIDIFFLGFVFFRTDFRVKQDFTVRF